jgi:hypothetical protein
MPWGGNSGNRSGWGGTPQSWGNPYGYGAQQMMPQQMAPQQQQPQLSQQSRYPSRPPIMVKKTAEETVEEAVEKTVGQVVNPSSTHTPE